jgi:3-polyprenyl-4-hydroxybenzoate decarboxylase
MVEWAIATRFQADKNAVVLSKQPGSSLDPSGDLSEGKKATTENPGEITVGTLSIILDANSFHELTALETVVRSHQDRLITLQKPAKH